MKQNGASHLIQSQPRKQFSGVTSHDLKRQNKTFKLKESIHFSFTSDYYERNASKSMCNASKKQINLVAWK